MTNVIDSRDRPTHDHHAVIVTTEDDYDAGKPIKVVFISTNFSMSSEEKYVEMLWDRRGHPQTGFRTRCAAMCDWLRIVEEKDILEYGKEISPAKLKDILEKMEELGSTQT